MATGTVKYFNPSKGFGFILADGGGADVFVHASAVEQAGLPPLVEGQRLTYETEPDPKGAKAINLMACPSHGEVIQPLKTAPKNGAVSQLTIYHNPDCQNSLNTLALLRTAGHEPRIIEYMKQPPSKAELKGLILLMGLSAHDVIRKVEPLYLELGLDAKNTSEDALIDAMVQYPVLINRPIVAAHSSALMCRPSRLVTPFIAGIPAS
jgi:arsenate reductase